MSTSELLEELTLEEIQTNMDIYYKANEEKEEQPLQDELY